MRMLYDKNFGLCLGRIVGIAIPIIGGLAAYALLSDKIAILTHGQVEKFIDYGSKVAYDYLQDNTPETVDKMLKALRK